ncbi:MAG TPA: response regulator, partial [Bacillota bacterium]|nr:response regulator [Bacillota bacterium]
MSIKKKIRVLIVDDSLLFRETLARGIAGDPAMEVVATASDPYEARDKIIEFEPDVMTLDEEMPRMNGIEFLRKLMPQHPLPVVMVSGVNANVFEALNAGAVDFVNKPDLKNANGLDMLINELIVKIKIASTARLGHW